MPFNSLHFVAFLAVVLALNQALLRHKAARRWMFIAASAYFYGQWNWHYLLLIYITVTVDFFLGHRIYRRLNARAALALSLGVNLGILALFKYGNFIVASLNTGLAAASSQLRFDTVDLLLPVGISFYTFQSLSYTFDLYREQLTPRRRFSDYALFVSFFPQLVAGPIIRASEFFKELDAQRKVSRAAAQAGFTLIVIGLLKKVVFADNLAALADPVFEEPGGFDRWMTLLAVYAFAFQIYFDFSGYTDIAIGVARLLGFNFPKNFDHPYMALSIREFWRRWHMTLSRWLRDYLYISLGGSRRGKGRTLINLMLTMLLGGLWHGASWNFVLWGALHGALLVGERQLAPAPPVSRTGRLLRWVLTFHLICLAWIFFRAVNFEDSYQLLINLFANPNPARFSATPGYGWASVMGLMALHRWSYQRQLVDRLSAARTVPYVVAHGVALVAVVLLAPLQAQPFIYFQF